MKLVLISIKSKWCDLSSIGQKTLEIRKTYPKLKTPFKVYVYESKGRQLFQTSDTKNMICPPDNGTYRFFKGRGKVIGEFVCDYILGHCEMALNIAINELNKKTV